MINYIKQKIEQENERMVKKQQWYELKFEYLGHTAMVTRYDEYGHLCGYIKKDFEMTDEVFDAIENASHGGITYDKDDWIGFDCNHARDFNLRMFLGFKEHGIEAGIETHMQDETYRTLDYAIETLQNMISAMTVERIKQENSAEANNYGN